MSGQELVFISCGSADKPIADAICHHLEEAGIRRRLDAVSPPLERRGDRAQNARLYLELDLEKDFGPENPQANRVRKKREQAEEGAEP